MTIHTTVAAKEYVCIVANFEMLESTKKYIGKVGLMTAVDDKNTFRFVNIDGVPMVFPKQNVQIISKKEYFKGLLSQ